MKKGREKMTLLESLEYAASVLMVVGGILIITGIVMIIGIKIIYTLYHSNFIQSFF